jgi:hypothetical protein
MRPAAFRPLGDVIWNGDPLEPRSFPRKWESSATIAHFQRFAEWIRLRGDDRGFERPCLANDTNTWPPGSGIV